MKRLVNAIVLTVSALVASASLVYAADTNCTGTLSGNIAGKVVVPSGASCTLSDATITGNVQVLQNASLTIDATQQPTTINGSIQASNCASALLKGGVTVSGSCSDPTLHSAQWICRAWYQDRRRFSMHQQRGRLPGRAWRGGRLCPGLGQRREHSLRYKPHLSRR
jgi:hypothetical protein